MACCVVSIWNVDLKLRGKMATHKEQLANLMALASGDDPRLRQALSMAIDREIITTAVTGGGEIPAYGWVPPIPGYTPQRPEWADWPLERRLEEARRLFAEAGYGEDRPLTVELYYNTSDNHKRIALAVAAIVVVVRIDLRRVGHPRAVVHQVAVHVQLREQDEKYRLIVENIDEGFSYDSSLLLRIQPDSFFLCRNCGPPKQQQQNKLDALRLSLQTIPPFESAAAWLVLLHCCHPLEHGCTKT